jgi:two-component system, NarL family, response regulator NreC
MSIEPVRVLIADDHTIVRSGVRLLLNAEADMRVVGEALDGREALELTESLRPDVVLMDIAMPVMDGLEATRLLKERFPHVHVIVLTMHRSDEYFFEMLKAGASGYILKAAKPGELVDAVRIVAKGQVFLYPTMAKKLLSDYLNRAESGSEGAQDLSPREKEILRLLAAGHSNKEIADKLVVSPSTIHSHRTNLMRKLGLSSRHELFQYARKHGLLDNV